MKLNQAAVKTIRFAIYLWLTRKVIRRILKLFLSWKGISRKIEKPLSSRFLEKSAKTTKRYWFHAASVGELECLWPVILTSANSSAELILTVFSDSAICQIRKLEKDISSTSAKILYSGFSPLEGEWDEFLSVYLHDVFITAKYEAWPELWASLSVNRIPLVIIGAKSRPSIIFAKKICRLLGLPIPALSFTTVSEKDSQELRTLFPDSDVQRLGDPRWDRVFERSRTGSRRAAELITKLCFLPKPWGVIGSAWEADIKLWLPFLKKTPGVVWLVPHKVDQEHLAPIEELVLRNGFKIIRTSRNEFSELSDSADREKTVVVVDEVGFLLELYLHADWAYIGGGFGAGIHSTIEPAIHGIRIAGGPKNADRFPEIEELTRTGQFTLIRTANDLDNWVRALLPVFQNQKYEFKQQALARLGATKSVWNAVEIAASSRPC